MEGNRYLHKVKWCPICDQGWIEVVKEIETGTLFCCCSECENEWDNPGNVERNTVNCQVKYGRVCEASEEEIKEKGYDRFIIND